MTVLLFEISIILSNFSSPLKMGWSDAYLEAFKLNQHHRTVNGLTPHSLPGLTQTLDGMFFNEKNFGAMIQLINDVYESQASSSPKIVKFDYIVRKGETLFRVAQKFRTTVDQIAEINGLTPHSDIKVGQKIIIQLPKDKDVEVVHVVREGETLYNISRMYNLTQDEIAQHKVM